MSAAAAPIVAGVDEAGRGPLAGPVVAAAVVLPRRLRLPGLTDSKLLSAAERATLYEKIVARASAWSIAWCDPAEIDAINILQATMLAMRRALVGLRITPDRVLVDGNRLPDLEFFGMRVDGDAIVRGDAKVRAISAASVLAKVARDRMMQQSDAVFPEYGFAQHKGYGTRRHLTALRHNGPCLQHRQSFRPVRDALGAGGGKGTDQARNLLPVRVTISVAEPSSCAPMARSAAERAPSRDGSPPHAVGANR